jgi:hypothetical protein
MRALLASAFLLAGGVAAAAEPSPIRTMDPLLGSWHCAGVFPASGKTIASTLRFESALDGAALLKRHDDLPPASYHALETWVFDAKAGQFRAAVADSGGIRRFDAPVWQGDRLTWSSAPDVQPAQKFVYVRQADGTLRVDWQVMRDGRFVVGDTLICKRQ